MLESGVYLPPSQFEAAFVSLAHTEDDIDAAPARRPEGLCGRAVEELRPPGEEAKPLTRPLPPLLYGDRPSSRRNRRAEFPRARRAGGPSWRIPPGESRGGRGDARGEGLSDLGLSGLPKAATVHGRLHQLVVAVGAGSRRWGGGLTRKVGTRTPWFLSLGALMGMVGGFISFFRTVLGKRKPVTGTSSPPRSSPPSRSAAPCRRAARGALRSSAPRSPRATGLASLYAIGRAGRNGARSGGALAVVAMFLARIGLVGLDVAVGGGRGQSVPAFVVAFFVPYFIFTAIEGAYLRALGAPPGEAA